MQLIDADEAIKRLGDAHFKNYGNAIMVIRETPTVDAQPVRHGHWVGIDDEPCEVWECDMCGYIYEGDFVYNYCPHCGAKMGDKDETD